MRKHLIKTIFNLLANFNITVEKMKDINEIKQLISKLRPFKTDKELIRLGAEEDGGYLVPDDLEGIEACFSPGVGPISEFETDCLKYGMQVFLADYSVDKLPSNNPNLNFLKKFIGPNSIDNFISLNDWIYESIENTDSDLLLQMDIEGAEYLSIIGMSDSLLNRFRIMVIEFHGLFKLWNDDFYSMAEATFSKILKNHTCVHIHPNTNCGINSRLGIDIPNVLEFTFLRNDRIHEKESQLKFPHKLDRANTIGGKQFKLPEIWYKG